MLPVPQSLFFNLLLTRRSFPADWDLGLVISISLVSLPRTTRPIKHILQSEGKEECTRCPWDGREQPLTLPVEAGEVAYLVAGGEK